MSGVIQIFTKRGSGETTIEGRAEGGSYSSARGGISVSGGIGEFDYALSGSHWATEGFSASSSGSERDPYRNTTASGRFVGRVLGYPCLLMFNPGRSSESRPAPRSDQLGRVSA